MDANKGNGLTLTRKTMEPILLFDKDGRKIATIILTRVEKHNHVRISIDAPPDIRILRQELWEEMQKAGKTLP